MDGTILELVLFLAATFAAALVAGLAGFAFGLVAAAVWLHFLTPLQATTLIIGFGLIVQGYAVWTLRHALNLARLWPFLVGVVPGVALGAWIAGIADPASMRIGVGVVLVIYAIYGLVRPALGPVQAGALADAGVGVVNGVLGAATGLAGIVVTIWSGLRGWPRDAQRTVFQPVGVATFALSALALGASGVIARDTVKLFLFGLPALLAGTWLGLKLYGRLDEAGFRRVVLLVLLVSGISLIVPMR